MLYTHSVTSKSVCFDKNRKADWPGAPLLWATLYTLDGTTLIKFEACEIPRIYFLRVNLIFLTLSKYSLKFVKVNHLFKVIKGAIPIAYPIFLAFL